MYVEHQFNVSVFSFDLLILAITLHTGGSYFLMKSLVIGFSELGKKEEKYPYCSTGGSSGMLDAKQKKQIQLKSMNQR